MLLLCATARYYRAISELKDIRSQRLKVLAQIKQLCTDDGGALSGSVAKSSFKIVVMHLHETFAKEDRFLRSYAHPSCADHTAEHARIRRELTSVAARLNGWNIAPLTELSHAFDSFLIHAAIDDDADFARVDIRCRPSAQGLCLS
jgi:hemerythrin